MKGHLSPWLFVECGGVGCYARLDLAWMGDRQKAIAELRRLGWVQTSEHYLCPMCARKEQR